MSYTANIIHKINYTSLGYGYLYNWYAVNTANFAPSGWHVPTQTEFNTLITYINDGGELKEAGVYHWDSPNAGATDAYGFSLFGAGIRTVSGLFNLFKSLTYLFTATEFDIDEAYVIGLNKDNISINDGYGFKGAGNSVRLIKNDSTNPGSLTDYEGNIYPTININGQIWTAKNWKCTKLNNGTSLTKVTDATAWSNLVTEGYCAYNNNDLNI